MMKKTQKNSEILNRFLEGNFRDSLENPTTSLDFTLDPLYKKYSGYFHDLFFYLDEVSITSNQLGGIIENVVESADDIRSSANFISDGTKKQQDEIEKCVVLTDNLSNEIHDMADLSDNLIASAHTMEDVSEDGKKAVTNLTVHQQKNIEANASIQDEIYILLEKAGKINEITEILSGIAQQTNLLALNASIEAARAGEAGKGFAVVAEQVRKLSEESSTASHNITESIQDIFNELETLKKVIDNSKVTFDNQEQAVTNVVDAFEEINSHIDHFISKQEDFHKQTEILDKHRNQLVYSVEEIFSITQESSAATEEIVSTAISQNSNANILSEMSYKLDQNLSKLNSLCSDISVEKTEIKQKKIGYIFDIETPFWNPTIQEAERTARAFNFELEFFAPKSRKTAASEILNTIEHYKAKKFDAIVISPVDSPEIRQSLNDAVKQGIQIIFISSKIDDVPYSSLVETNGMAAGQFAANIVKRLLNNTGEIAVGLWSDVKIESIENRAKGLIQELERNSNIQVHTMSVQSTPDSAELTRYIGEIQANYPNTRLIYTTNINWGLALSEYITKHSLDFNVITVDFTAEIQDYISSGCISAAIAQRAFAWGSKPLELLQNIFEGKSVEKYFDSGVYEVNAKNMKVYSNRI